MSQSDAADKVRGVKDLSDGPTDLETKAIKGQANETESYLDPDVAQFYGFLPDLPAREPQAEYESRESLS